MKYVKMLGLAAVAAAALMAFVGASTASATVTCKVPGTGPPTGTTCPAGQAYGEKTELHAVLDPGTGNALLTNGSGETQISCPESTVSGKSTNEGSATETEKGNVETLTFSKCFSPAFFNAPCKVTTLKGGTLEVHWIEGTHNGTVTSNGAEVTTLCETFVGNIHCIFVTENDDLGKITGGEPATMDIESTPLRQIPTSSLCPSEAKWDAKYQVTSPSPIYVAGHT